jgi:hypothetical protein
MPFPGVVPGGSTLVSPATLPGSGTEILTVDSVGQMGRQSGYTQAQVDAAITAAVAALIAGAPSNRDTLAELATALASTDAALAGRLSAASNLSDLASTATARTNLGLGDAALLAASSAINQPFGSTITWTGTTAPSGTAQLFYSWVRIGMLVFGVVRMEFETAGTGVTQVVYDMPGDLPAPQLMTGHGSSEVLNFGSGGVKTSASDSGSANTTEWRLQINSAAQLQGFGRFPSTGLRFLSHTFAYIT